MSPFWSLAVIAGLVSLTFGFVAGKASSTSPAIGTAPRLYSELMDIPVPKGPLGRFESQFQAVLGGVPLNIPFQPVVIPASPLPSSLNGLARVELHVLSLIEGHLKRHRVDAAISVEEDVLHFASVVIDGQSFPQNFVVAWSAERGVYSLAGPPVGSAESLLLSLAREVRGLEADLLRSADRVAVGHDEEQIWVKDSALHRVPPLPPIYRRDLAKIDEVTFQDDTLTRITGSVFETNVSLRRILFTAYTAESVGN